MVLLEEQDSGPVWVIASATPGSSLQATIDDASGKVLEVKRMGVRWAGRTE